MAREINLVPDIKNEMIKAIKVRNLTFFICIVVSVGSIAVALIIGLIAGGQTLAVNSKQTSIETMSSKIKNFDNLDQYLTIKDQVGNIATLTNNKKVVSRTLDVLAAVIQPVSPNTINISEISVSLAGDTPTFSFDAQVDATREPYIDYNVLDSFKKSMPYLKYDYGDYVDKNGSTIPAYCIIDTATDGTAFKEGDSYYALWKIDVEGCNPAATTGENATQNDYTMEEYEGEQVVKIWRTPQYDDWYHETASSTEPNMDLNGQITNVAHFESECITYSGAKGADGKVVWTEQNDSCLLIPGGSEGLVISDSSNGRSSDDNLVLRFSATVAIDSKVFDFSSHHVMYPSISGHYDVTDSYVQIQNIFAERAADCADGDTACKNNGSK